MSLLNVKFGLADNSGAEVDYNLPVTSGAVMGFNSITGLPEMRSDASYGLSSHASGYLTADTCTIVALGDSLTSGTGASDAAHAYPQVLDASYLPSNFTVVNAGTSGDTIAQMAARYTTDVHPSRPAVGHIGYLLLRGGTNDLRSGGTAADAFTALEALIATAKADGFYVIISTLPNCFNASPAIIAEYTKLNNKLRDGSSANSLYDAATAIPQMQQFHDKDGIHYTDNGYNLDAYGWDQVLRRPLGVRYPMYTNPPTVQFSDGFDVNGNLSLVYPSVHGSDFDTGLHWAADRINVILGGVGRYAFTTGEFRPLSGGVYNLGTTGLTWVDAFFSGVIKMASLLFVAGPTLKSGTGAPAGSEPNGSVWLRSDGTGPNLYVRENGAWVAK